MNNALLGTRSRTWWKVLRVFSVLLSVFVAVMILILPQTGGDQIRTSIIFIFYPIFYFLDGLRLFQLQDYGMGSMAMIVTVPLGVLWVACITSLTLFGPGKWKALNDQRYAVIRKAIIFLGTLYLMLCVGMFVSFFLGV